MKLECLRAFIPSLFFCIKYLPFRQAVKLPILVYKPQFLKMKGKVSINTNKVYFGMVRLGFPLSAVYQNSGITFRNEGSIIFNGRCWIGNDSYIVCGKNGLIEFGDDFWATAGIKIVSECGISFGTHTLIGWGNIIIDTNFHPLFDIKTHTFKKAFGQISIGKNNWLSSQCMILYGVVTPDDCVFGARSILTKGVHYESCCVYGGSPLRILSRNVMRIVGKDTIMDYKDGGI